MKLLPALDFRTLFETSPGLYLVLLPDFTIVGVSDAYLNATTTEREVILGAGLFEVFPGNSDDLNADAVSNLRASLNYVLKYGKPHTMALQKYDIRNPDGTFVQKFWRPLNTPVFSKKNKLLYIIHNVEELTGDHQAASPKDIGKINEEHLFLNKEKEKQAVELLSQNKELAFQYQYQLKEIADYKYALDESSIVAITDQKGTAKYVNDNFCNISKYSHEELIGHHHRIINSGHHSGEFIKNLWTTIANGKIWKGELKNKAKDGTIYWVDTTIVPFLDEKGKPYQYVAIQSDITERKQVEELLTIHKHLVVESEEKEKRVAELMIANEELAFQNEEKEKRAAALLLANKELTIQSKEKEKKEAGLLIANKELLFQYDEKAKREAELTETLEPVNFLATITNNIQEIIITSDNNFKITRWNDAAEKILEWKSEEVIGKTTVDILNTIYLDQSREQILAVINEKGIWNGELIYHTKSGRKVNVFATASKLKDADGNIAGNLILVRDITDHKKAEEKLKEFQFFFNNSNDLSCIANKEGYFEILNPSFEKVLGYSQNELSKTPFIEFVHPDDVAATLHEYGNLKAGAIVIHFTNRYRKKNGEYRWFEWNASSNLLTGKLYCIARDITDRKNAEDALNKLNEELEQKVIDRTDTIKRSEQQYRHLFHNNPIPMWVIDLSNFKFLDVNDMAILHYGFSRKEFLSMTALDIRPEEDKAAFLKSDHSYATDQSNYNKGKWRHRKKNGSIIKVEIIGHEILFEGNKAKLVLAHDITEQQEAEEKLIRSETNLRAIFENTSEGFLLVDREGFIKTFNSKAIEYSFFSQENNFQVGHSLFQYIEESREPVFRKLFSKVMNGESIHYERSYEAGMGNISWLDFSITPVWDEGAISGACVSGRNITQKKLMEQEILAQKIQEQRKISRAIIKAQEHERNHMGQELHDNVNQILAGTKLYLSMIAKDEESKELIKYPLELIETAIQEIRSLSSKKVTPIKNINLRELIQKLLADLEMNSSVNTVFKCNITDHVHDDELKLNIYRIIQEQLSNIMKHAAAKNVTLSAIAKDHKVHIVITDDGKGFDTTKKRKGIGISNMINRIESFNGIVIIESSPGSGCKTEINIPY